MSINSQVILIALVISSLIALTLATTRLAPRTGEASFRDIIELRERLCSDRSVFINFEVFVTKRDHLLEICVESGCRRITVTETWIITPVSSSPIIKPEDFAKRGELFALYSNRTYAGMSTGIQFEFTDEEVVVTYVEAKRIGKTRKLILSKEVVDELVIYVENASILLDGKEIAIINGFSKIKIKKVVLEL